MQDGARTGPSRAVVASPPSQTLSAIRAQVPLVHNITNLVAMDLAANLLLAVGASPAMVQAPEEVEDFVARADALSVNVGTLSALGARAMAAAAREAMAQGKPWVLDPVGVGATSFRSETVARLCRLRPTVIRGNAAEILALGEDEQDYGHGVDSLIGPEEALDAAHDLAKSSGAVVAVTGPIDYVTDGRRIVAVANGDPLMTRVTAMGCALTCLMAACCAVESDAMAAAAHALAIMGVAAERAAEGAAGPASFRVRLIDALYSLDEATLDDGARID